MIQVAEQTGLAPASIIERASKSIGKGGEEPTETGWNLCCIYFEGVGGHVAASVVDETSHRTVDVESRWVEYLTKKFLKKPQVN